MKIRAGFVSNSSSSCFIILTSKENHERVLSGLSEIEKKIIDKFMCGFKFMGHDCLYGEDYSLQDWDESSIDFIRNSLVDDGMDRGELDDIYEMWEKYKKQLREKPEEVFSHHFDM